MLVDRTFVIGCASSYINFKGRGRMSKLLRAELGFEVVQLAAQFIRG
jgi:hypothetical protein